MKYRNIENRKGVTLIELLIVIALIGVVLSVVYSMFFFGNRTFSQGETQYGLQSEAKFAIETAMKDIRYATNIRITDSTTPGPYETIIYYNNNSIIKKFGESIETINFHNNSAVTVPPLSFIMKNGNKSIEYKLNGKDGNRDFILKSEIELLNLQEFIVEGISPNVATKAIAYITPEAHRAQDLNPTITIPSPNTNSKTQIALIYNRQKNSYVYSFKVYPTGNNNKLTVGDIKNIVITDLGTNSQISFTLDLITNSVSLKKDDLIEITLTPNFGDTTPFVVKLVYNTAGAGSWDIQ